MGDKLILNLRLEEGDCQGNFSLVSLVLNKLKQFKSAGINVEYFELRVHPLQDSPDNSDHKEAYLKIDADDRTFTDSQVSHRWDDAILTACERLRRRFLSCQNNVNAMA